MPSINEVIERVNRARPDAIDDETKAAWLLELDGQLYRGDHPAAPAYERARGKGTRRRLSHLRRDGNHL